jgi:hypothetical protein
MDKERRMIMLDKCLVYGAFGVLFSMSAASAMLECDHKTLNRKVDAYVMAITEKQPITKENLKYDLQFLSADAVKDPRFADYTKQEKFDNLYARKATIRNADISAFIDQCKVISPIHT